MTPLVGGDPASVSSLAATLMKAAEALEAQARSLNAGVGAGLGAGLDAGLDGLRDAGRALSACGHALQDYAVDLQQARALAAQADRARTQEQEAARRLVRRVAEPVHALRDASDAVASVVRTAVGRKRSAR